MTVSRRDFSEAQAGASTPVASNVASSTRWIRGWLVEGDRKTVAVGRVSLSRLASQIRWRSPTDADWCPGRVLVFGVAGGRRCMVCVVVPSVM
ncbi:hypothetical protein [Amycolatopsis sp. lyj-23]|uniref:hypothetical protein n=1 Tax=Amycolatopsis sp. lyj-23 TaxID=2789283 RepID=UPI00397C485D